MISRQGSLDAAWDLKNAPAELDMVGVVRFFFSANLTEKIRSVFSLSSPAFQKLSVQLHSRFAVSTLLFILSPGPSTATSFKRND